MRTIDVGAVREILVVGGPGWLRVSNLRFEALRLNGNPMAFAVFESGGETVCVQASAVSAWRTEPVEERATFFDSMGPAVAAPVGAGGVGLALPANGALPISG